MKIHNVVVDEILGNRPFHDACEAAFKEAGYEIALPFKGAQVAAAVAPQYVPVVGVIMIGDEWERKDRPGVWKAVSDSVGKTVDSFPNSNFRRRA